MPNWPILPRILLFTGKGGVGKTSLSSLPTALAPSPMKLNLAAPQGCR